MKPLQRKRVVSETFETELYASPFGKPYLLSRALDDAKLQPGDRVRVKVTKLERGK